MADSENLNVVIKARGGEEAARQALMVERALAGVGLAAKSTRVQVADMGEKTAKTGSLMGSTIGIALRYAAAYRAIGAATTALGAGFRFDATMESNTIAFKHFLGSAQAADSEVQSLFKIAATTPFEFSDVATATRRFLAFGFSVKDANKELGIVGDAIAGMGGGAQEINQLVRALGQIKAKGRLQGDELLQLTELGIIGPQQIAAQLNMTQKEFQKAVEAGKISSEQAITAINNVLTSTFQGSAAEQAKTFTGQLSTIRDYGSQAAGALVKPLFDLARSGVMPKISAGLQSITRSLNAGGAKDIAHYLAITAQIVGPLAGTWLAYRAAIAAVNGAMAVYIALQAGAALAGELRAAIMLVPAVTSLAEAWWLLNAAIEGTWLAAIGPIGWVIGAIAIVTALYFKWKWFHNAVNDTFAAVMDVIRAVKQAVDLIQHPFGKGSGGGGGLPGGSIPGGSQSLGVGGLIQGIKGLFHADGGTIPIGGVGIVGERGPEIARSGQGGTTITPMAGASPSAATRILQPVQMAVNGRVFGEIMLDIGQTAQARQ